MPPQRQQIRKRFRSLSSDKTVNPALNFTRDFYVNAASRSRGFRLMLAVRLLWEQDAAGSLLR